jgi:hypothetical protein
MYREGSWLFHFKYAKSPFLQLQVSTKSLRKAEKSDFLYFRKIRNTFFPYSVFFVLRQNPILQNTKHNTEYSKPLFLGQKSLFFGLKTLYSDYSVYTVYKGIYGVTIR